MDNTYNRLREAVAALKRWDIGYTPYGACIQHKTNGTYVSLADVNALLAQFPAQERSDDQPAVSAPAGDEEVAYKAWFQNEQGKAYDGMWTFARAAWMARAAQPAIPGDSPEFDCTDAAHPAWWRGNDYGFGAACRSVVRILDGKDDGRGMAGAEWEPIRRRLMSLVATPGDGGAVPVAKLHADGYWTHEPGRDPFDRFGPNANAAALDVYTTPPRSSEPAAVVQRDDAAYRLANQFDSTKGALPAEFEAWYGLECEDPDIALSRNAVGSYNISHTQIAFHVWQAAWSRAPSAEAKDASMVERVARALHASENKTSGWTWQECSPIEVEGWMELAEAAIAAIAQRGAAAARGTS